jgi:hypothetical protein
MPKLQEKLSSPKREHPALQKMKILDFFLFCGSFLPSWIRIRIQQLKLMRIHADPDPDPKPWKNAVLRIRIWDPGSDVFLTAGSGIPTPYFRELSDNCLNKKFYNSLKSGQIFFFSISKIK